MENKKSYEAMDSINKYTRKTNKKDVITLRYKSEINI